MNVDLTQEEAEYLSVLIRVDTDVDRRLGLTSLVNRHLLVWEKLQPVVNGEGS